MASLEDAKRGMAEAAGPSRPQPEAPAGTRSPRFEKLRLDGDAFVPNHPFWPLLLYRAAVRLPKDGDPAAILEDLFRRNGWGGTWRNGVYGYTHYHSQIHEALGVARGAAKLQFGGESGPILDVTAGDVAVLPAGTGHKRIEASGDFLVVGAYPPEGKYDECTRPDDRERALATIVKTARPATDPVYGADGPLLNAWA